MAIETKGKEMSNESENKAALHVMLEHLINGRDEDAKYSFHRYLVRKFPVVQTTEEKVKDELTAQYVVERDALIEAVDEKVDDYIKQEFEELRADILKFRDLELKFRDLKADYDNKLVEAKAEMAQQLKKDLCELVEKVDSFLEIRIKAELDAVKKPKSKKKTARKRK